MTKEAHPSSGIRLFHRFRLPERFRRHRELTEKQEKPSIPIIIVDLRAERKNTAENNKRPIRQAHVPSFNMVIDREAHDKDLFLPSSHL